MIKLKLIKGFMYSVCYLHFWQFKLKEIPFHSSELNWIYRGSFIQLGGFEIERERSYAISY